MGTPNVIVLGLTLSLASGCATGRAGQGREVAELRREVDVLRQRNGTLKHSVRTLEDRVFVLEDKLETVEIASARRPDAVPRLPVVKKGGATPAPEAEAEAQPREVDSPPPLEDPNRRVNADEIIPGEAPPAIYGEDVEVVYVGDAAHTDGRRPRIELDGSSSGRRPAARRDAAAAPLPSTGGDRLPVAPVPPIPGKKEMGASPVAMYQEAFSSLKRRDHAVAIAAFRAFLERWPEHEYADNAQYWLAEAYYDRREFENALAEFRRVVERYGSGNKAPDALVKIGYCYQKLGDTAAARDVLAQVIDIYPRTNAAGLAAQRLEELGKGSP